MKERRVTFRKLVWNKGHETYKRQTFLIFLRVFSNLSLQSPCLVLWLRCRDRRRRYWRRSHHWNRRRRRQWRECGSRSKVSPRANSGPWRLHFYSLELSLIIFAIKIILRREFGIFLSFIFEENDMIWMNFKIWENLIAIGPLSAWFWLAKNLTFCPKKTLRMVNDFCKVRILNLNKS